VKLY